MANYYGSARSNWFRVKDPAKFNAWVVSIDGLGRWETPDDPTKFAIYSLNERGWPCAREMYETQATGRVYAEDGTLLHEDTLSLLSPDDFMDSVEAHAEATRQFHVHEVWDERVHPRLELDLEDTGSDYQDFDLAQELAEHLVDTDVAVLMEVGAEKLRYLIGEAVAVNAKGEVCTINLGDIYKQAAQLGEVVTFAEY